MDARLARVLRLAGRRALEAVPLLLVVSGIAFGLLQLVPGGPLEVYLSNPGVRPEDLERLRRALGLDRPLWEQYVSWLAAFARGDWGYSFSDGRPVLARVVERLPASIELLAASLVLALAAALPAGIVAAVRARTAADRVITAVASAGIAIPAFWMGLMLQLVFAIGLGWLPSSGRAPQGAALMERLQHLAMPAAVLAFVHGAAWSRYLRASLVEVLGALFLAAARARGVAERDRLLRHALPNALAPVATVVLLDAALLVPGAVVTESVFAWPGVGSLFTEALGRRDYTVLMAMLMVSSLAVVVFNLMADVVHAWLDSAGDRMTRAWATLAALVLVAAVAPLLAPYAPDAIDLANRREGPAAAHWFGTDDLGRDVFSRVLYGGRVSIAIGLLSALVAAGLGVAVGAVAGYVGGWTDTVLMRGTDAVLSIPRLLLLMVAAATLQPSVPALVVLVGAVGWMETARVTRAAVRSLAAREFVMASLAAGAGHVRIVWRHLLANAAGAIRTAAVMAVGRAILVESALSFFGVGVQPPDASWGSMLYQAQAAMSTEPWLALFPGACIVLTVGTLNAISDRN